MFRSALVLFNISKSHNFGQIIRTANALGASEILIVGRKKFSRHGNFGTYESQKFHHFYSLEAAIDYLRSTAYKVLGVEVDEHAIPVEDYRFDTHCAFLLGNEGTGLSQQQKVMCDGLVYIKQYGIGASLNVNVAAGIVLNHFSVTNKFPENTIENDKFIKKNS